MNRRPNRARRRRFFLGCEGESEQAYGALLQRLADAAGLSVHIVAKNLQPAGDPFALADKAARVFTSEERKGRFAFKAILLDTDTLVDVPAKGPEAQARLERDGFTAIWQEPNHEALLLRHFAGRERDQPQRDRTMAALRAQWPDYRKNMPAADLLRMLSLEHVLRAASVTPNLMLFLRRIGFNAP